jgi:uncharacterized membrane protein
MREKTIHQIFDISVTLKGLHALLEIASGVILYLVSTATLVQLVDGLTRTELIEDPNDFLARHVIKFAEGLSPATHHFYAFYLLSHGLVKAILVVGLLGKSCGPIQRASSYSVRSSLTSSTATATRTR